MSLAYFAGFFFNSLTHDYFCMTNYLPKLIQKWLRYLNALNKVNCMQSVILTLSKYCQCIFVFTFHADSSIYLDRVW